LAVAHATLTISETGSTLILPLFKSWVTAYSKVNPELQMTVGATGSAAGITEAIAKHAQIGTSDAYMSAAFAKIGAVATAFLFPILLVSLGTRLLLYGLVIASLLGAVVTWFYRIETTGVNLDRIGEAEATSEAGASSKAVA
jgi:hypothetical protein